MNEQTKSSLDMLDKAMQARQGEAEVDRATVQEMWETAVGALRKDTEMMVQANARVISSWANIAKIMCGDIKE